MHGSSVHEFLLKIPKIESKGVGKESKDHPKFLTTNNFISSSSDDGGDEEGVMALHG